MEMGNVCKTEHALARLASKKMTAEFNIVQTTAMEMEFVAKESVNAQTAGQA
jgi:hypothetical protein